MAARLNPKNQQSVRDKIQATQLVNRLTDHALGKISLEATQIKAIEILLKKSVPDLSAVTISGDAENPLVTTSIDYKMDSAEATRAYTESLKTH
jgi:hypothetical protein